MGTSFDPQQAAEFDKYAGRYEDMHRDSVKASGEDPEVLRHIQTAGARAAARARIRPAGPRFRLRHRQPHPLSRALLPTVEGYDPSTESARLAAEVAPGARFYDSTAAIPRERFGAVIVATSFIMCRRASVRRS